MNHERTTSRESFVFYRSFYDSIVRLPDSVQLILFRAVAAYALNQEEPDFSGVDSQPFVEAIFSGIRPQIDANQRRFVNGCKGGAPKGSHNNPNGRKGKTNQQLTNNKPNENDNVNVNENVKVDIEDSNTPADVPLDVPFKTPKAIKTWQVLRSMPKWRNKTNRSLQMALNQLSKYREDFAVYLMENAISGNYQGVVFDDTPTRYQRWLQITPLPSHKTAVITDLDHLYD